MPTEVKDKPFYKKFKVMTGLATLLVDAVIFICASIFMKEVSPVVIQFMTYVLATGIAIITGHSITDAASAIGKAKK